ncbi:hypothetical protein [Lunatimonas salinarum]|uniref:hypothetical protein n=1 Tax=Lunatimonas salinarum TaxID=1774590 RepID=UPI001FD87115|nr:hypothetical protein [Lunatimonas salinarum]
MSVLLSQIHGSLAGKVINDDEKVAISPKRTLEWKDFKTVKTIQGKSSINALCLSTCDIEIKRVIPKGSYVQLEVKALVNHKNDLSQVTENFLTTNDEATKAQVLHHENGHFLIAQIIGYRIVKDAQGFQFHPKNYKSQLNQLISGHFRYWKQMDQLYDLETTKPRNPAMQKKWDEYFAKELAKLKAAIN